MPRAKRRLQSLDELDGRLQSATKARSLVTAMENDLGGSDQLTTAQRELVKRSALLGAIAEDFEIRWLKHEPVTPIATDHYLRAVGVQHRVLQTIGLERRSKTVTPTLEAYAREVTERAEREPDTEDDA
jgi:hypothetical protein